jgi:uncharacterized protein GlcG (DUF336 family)
MGIRRLLGIKKVRPRSSRGRKIRPISVQQAEILENRICLSGSAFGHAAGLVSGSSVHTSVTASTAGTTKPAVVTTVKAATHSKTSTKTVQQPISMAAAQLSPADVQQILDRAEKASASNGAIIVVVDAQGNILGVRVESGVVAPNNDVLSFMIDGAVAEARTGAFFASGDPTTGTIAPLNSRTVEFISQSTITQREVEAMPDSPDPTIQGPGFVAPIGLGGHFPPGINNTPNADLFDIEHTNRDSLTIQTPGGPIVLPDRFNINPAFVPPGQQIAAPLPYGVVSGLDPNDQSRGLGTLPGGLPIFRDSNGDGLGDTLVGGIGVFFPGPDGFATHEQGFIFGKKQTEQQRMNTHQELEAEYIAFAAVGGSKGAHASIGAIGGTAPVTGLDLPFGAINLAGISLPLYGPSVGRTGAAQLVAFGKTLGIGSLTGTAEPVAPGPVFYLGGVPIPDGFLVTPHSSLVDNLTAADVTQIIQQGIAGANAVQSAIRVPLGARAKMVFAVTDTTGEVLGLYRMPGATFFSIAVAVAKARNDAYYDNAAELQAVDQVVQAGVSFTSRTFRFLAEPRYPSGVDGSTPPPFSILNDPGINPTNAENLGAPTPASAFQTAAGFDAFNPNTNFHDPFNRANQNGVVFFPGSSALYKNGQLIGGLGVSGDGVNQDDVVTYIAVNGFGPPNTVTRADQVFFRGVRLPYNNFSRNPFG